MSFQDLGELLADGREMAEADMTDQCIIRRVTAPGVFDDSTGTRATATRVVIYPRAGEIGKCSIKVSQLQPDVPTSGEHRFVVGSVQVSIPLGGPDVEADDEMEIIASAFDQGNVGREFTVLAGVRKSHATAYRIQTAEVVG